LHNGGSPQRKNPARPHCQNQKQNFQNANPTMEKHYYQLSAFSPSSQKSLAWCGHSSLAQARTLADNYVPIDFIALLAFRCIGGRWLELFVQNQEPITHRGIRKSLVQIRCNALQVLYLAR
jgi:hypothetical protein